MNLNKIVVGSADDYLEAVAFVIVCMDLLLTTVSICTSEIVSENFEAELIIRNYMK